MTDHWARIPVALAALLVAACGTTTAAPSAARREVVRIWPGKPPGSEGWTGAEVALDADLPAGWDR